MGKISQRKKQLRAQHKRRESKSKSLEVHPASIPIKAGRIQQESPTFLTIPLEIRFKVVSVLEILTHLFPQEFFTLEIANGLLFEQCALSLRPILDTSAGTWY